MKLTSNQRRNNFFIMDIGGESSVDTSRYETTDSIDTFSRTLSDVTVSSSIGVDVIVQNLSFTAMTVSYTFVFV